MYAFEAYMRTSTTGAKRTKIDPTETVFRVQARAANLSCQIDYAGYIREKGDSTF